jgi:hypothetical protein
MGDGIRRSKDLRAEIGKFPNSTNERKQMSIKTLRKRISLVTATVLAAGTLSVVSMPVANAYIPVATGCSNVAGVASLTNISSDCTSSGVLSAFSGTGTTQTATMLSTGTLGIKSSSISDSSHNISIVVQGGTIAKALHNDTTASYISLDGTVSTTATTGLSAANGVNHAAHIKPSAGVTSMIVQMYTGASVTYSTPTNGTLTSQMVVTITPSSAYGVPSASKSTVYFTATAGGTASATEDATSANYSKANGGIVYATLNLNDAYSNDSVPGGTMIFEVTGGAKVDVNTTAGSVSTSGSTVTSIDFEAATDSDGLYYVGIAQGTANAAANFTLTVKHSSGIVIATKTGKITGEVATFTAAVNGIAGAGQTNEDALTVSFKDAAGNTVYPTSSYGEAPASGYTNAIVTDVTLTEWPTSSATGYADVVCGSVGGSTKMKMNLTTPSGTTVSSNEVTVNCADEGWTYAASWDKASYTPGSLATLTITVKDDSGRAANDYHYLANLGNNYDGLGNGKSSTAADLVTVTGGPAAAAVTIPAYGDQLTDGKKTYTFIVGSTEGDYQAVISVPAINTANSAQKAVTAGYSIKVANAGVTNADVLKSIVALIASINKQIQALQKLILKR